ncbi:MAG: hypothetical protein HY319_24565 [Armatimonadetes bacterium]|nr:hypothetical protein [Armatimonadota bacterium]
MIRDKFHHWQQQRAIGQLKPLNTPGAGPGEQTIVDEYNRELVTVRDVRVPIVSGPRLDEPEVSFTARGDKVVCVHTPRGDRKETLSPDGALRIEWDYPGEKLHYDRGIITFLREPDGLTRHEDTRALMAASPGECSFRETDLTTQLTLQDGTLDQKQKFVAAVPAPPAHLDEAAAEAWQQYTDGARLVLDTPPGTVHTHREPRTDEALVLGADKTVRCRLSPDNKTSTVEVTTQSPTDSTTYSLTEGGNLVIQHTGHHGWGVVHTDHERLVFAPGADGSLQRKRSGSTTSERSDYYGGGGFRHKEWPATVLTVSPTGQSVQTNEAEK